MTPTERTLLQGVGRSLLYRNLIPSLMITVLCYSIFAPLCILIIDSLIRSETRSGLSRGMLTISITSCLAFSATMALEIVAAFGIFDLFTGQTELDLTDRLVAINDSGFKYDLASNWLVYCIPILNDAIIIWRAWIIAGRRRWALTICLVLWIASLGMTLSFLILDSVQPNILSDGPNIYNDLLSTSIFLTFGTNMLTTSFIAYTLWRTFKHIPSINHRELFTSWHILLLLVESGVIYGVLQFINAVMNVTPFTAPSTMVTFYVLQSILTSFSMAYPTLTVGIIRGPFSLVRVADTVVEIRSEGDSDERVITPHADPQSHHYVT